MKASQMFVTNCSLNIVQYTDKNDDGQLLLSRLKAIKQDSSPFTHSIIMRDFSS